MFCVENMFCCVFVARVFGAHLGCVFVLAIFCVVRERRRCVFAEIHLCFVFVLLVCVAPFCICVFISALVVCFSDSCFSFPHLLSLSCVFASSVSVYLRHA